jgi:type I restriction enzyme M protein
MIQQSLSWFIGSVADLFLVGYKQSECGKVILPFTVLRRFACVLEPTKQAVLAEQTARKKQGLNAGLFLPREAKWSFYNTVGELNLEGSPRIKT